MLTNELIILVFVMIIVRSVIECCFLLLYDQSNL